MIIELKVENDMVTVVCNGEKLACRWMLNATGGNEHDAVDLILFHCREHLLKELKELKDG
jgi:hypothetical protein